jgi:hypothetical protein
MFAQAMHFATAPLRLVNADVPSCDYGDARASRAADRARDLRPTRTDAPKPNCMWEANETGGESRRSLDESRAP